MLLPFRIASDTKLDSAYVLVWMVYVDVWLYHLGVRVSHQSFFFVDRMTKKSGSFNSNTEVKFTNEKRCSCIYLSRR